MDRTKHFSAARKDTEIIRISRKTQGTAFLAKATYPLKTSVNSNNYDNNNMVQRRHLKVLPFQLALRTVII